MKNYLLLRCLLAAGCAVSLLGQQPAKPKLVVGIVIDQFRYDYLTRFRNDYHGGLDQFLRRGAVFTNAHYRHTPTVTAVGHSIFMSGAMPSVSGIVNNSWYDRASHHQVTSVCDWEEKVVGAPQPAKSEACTDEDPASPRRFLVSTVGDELRNANESSKVVGISLKARAAIMPAGHRANGAYWFDTVSGNFVTSTFFRDELPAWADAFNKQKLPEQYVDKAWPGFPSWSFKPKHSGDPAFENIPAGPWGNELIERFAEAALTSEKLGQRGVTDLLTVSFSSNDYVGHAVGPDAPEVRDMSLRVDVLIGKFFQALDKQVGLDNCIIVLTADHGVSPSPEVSQRHKMPGAAIKVNPAKVVTQALDARFGSNTWIEDGSSFGIYFNPKVFKDLPTKLEIFDTARQAILNDPDLHAVRVYDSTQLSQGLTGDFVAQAFTYGFFPRNSPDLVIVYEPYAMPGNGHGTTHFAPYDYDNHVPVLWLGNGIKAGRYTREIMPNDIAPTLATILDIEIPSGSSGNVLPEIAR